MESYIQETVEVIKGKEVKVEIHPPQGSIPRSLMSDHGNKFKPSYAQKKPDIVPHSDFCNWNEDAIYC